MRVRGPSRLCAVVAALFAVLAVGAGPAVAAPTGPITNEPGVTATLHMVRLNCDDEAERFSDEVALYVNGHFQGVRGNLDGGDWWPLHPEIGFIFGDKIHIVFEETSAHIKFIDVEIDTSDRGRGELVVPGSGWDLTGWAYRFTYYVD
ncbi:MAG TPA: hypothetical protein VMU51_02930 [Mycobacteriales bacterium]|nr:hypothetical protein [Mycobacteriales bacterium]